MSKYNSDELEVPEWLNETFIEDVLRKHENNKHVKVLDYIITPGTEQGDHFASIMFRITANYSICDKSKEISLILKTMPVKGMKRELIGSSNAFETEITMYSKIIPKFHKILRDVGDDTILGVNMIYSSLDPVKVIIFEDISKLGYQMVPEKFLGVNEIDHVLNKICRWHAISFKVLHEDNERNAELKESIIGLKEGIFNFQKSMDFFFNDAIEAFSKVLIELDLDSIYSEKFERIKGSIVKRCSNISKLQGDLCILNHGDFHINNMMIKFGENKIIKDLMLLDFQFCVAGPIVIDLTYLLFAVTNYGHNRDEIIYKYYRKFVEMLNKLGFKGKVPSLIDINREMLLYKDLELIMVVAFLPFAFAIQEKVELDNELMEDPSIYRRFFNIPAYKERIKEILPEILYKGYLD